ARRRRRAPGLLVRPHLRLRVQHRRESRLRSRPARDDAAPARLRPRTTRLPPSGARLPPHGRRRARRAGPARVIAFAADTSPWLAVLGRAHPLLLHLPLGALPCLLLLEFGFPLLRR